ncbi:helix-turn-helix transcriptional regulator [Vibrio diazotrophicus]|uniref:helix-turn-helix transcriptional regulator n=1 Tax=Vibrio diazotrophicus TaxID=685 RepID=UPI00142E5436|nr:helix-turn-helix domain-containing protein [Vibrio diazotrophicus]NIY92582.1 helix-turn-helix domain-containing protein [Vibrio diazotrophicus]
MRSFDYIDFHTKGSVKIIRKKKLAKMLGVSESTLYRMIKSKRLPAPLLTPKGYISGWLPKTLDDWIKKQ